MSDTDPAPRPGLHLEVLRVGSPHHDLVEIVQTFLRGRDLYHGRVDGGFGPLMLEGVKAFQRLRNLKDDGVVGNFTWAEMMALGLVVLPSDVHESDHASPNWPPRPEGIRPLTSAQRAQLFGTFEFQPAPVKGDPEAIRITERSPEYRIIEVELPELVGVQGFPSSGKILFHARGARQLQDLVKAWAAAGLRRHILTWGGSLAQRFVRGSRTTLSAHAWGTALDINAAWNGLGAQGALAGRYGSVRELVPLAVEHGFYSGGWFSRPDWMHLELFEVK